MRLIENDFRSSRWITVHLAGGGEVRLLVGMSHFLEVAEALDRRRSLLGQIAVDDGFGGETWVPALIPASRVNLVLDADEALRQ